MAPLAAAVADSRALRPAGPMAAELAVLREGRLLLSALGALPTPAGEAIARRAGAVSLAMANRLERGHRLATGAELEAYAYGVSGLLVDLFALYNRRIAIRRDHLLRLAPEFGAALHLANVLAGIRADHVRGAVWILEEWLDTADLTPGELAADPGSARAKPVVRRLADGARRRMPGAVGYVAAIPAREYRVRLACAWPLAMAATSLPGAPRRPAPAVLVHTALIAWSGRLLMRYYAPSGPRGA